MRLDPVPERYLAAPSDAVTGTLVVSGNVVTFTPTEALAENEEWTVIVLGTVADEDGVTLGEPFGWTFTTAYSPLYASLEAVVATMGDIGTTFSADQIYRAIRAASNLAVNISPRAGTGSASSIDLDDPPIELTEYVRIKSAIDLILQRSTAKLIDQGEEMELGDLRVRHDRIVFDFTGLLKVLNRQLAPWEALLMNGAIGISKAVSRGSAGNPYPFESRQFGKTKL